MFVADFDFELPAGLIAQQPAEPRDQSRLMVLNRVSGQIAHHQFTDLPALLDKRDILVRNNTQVVPARLVGRREATGGAWQGLFLRDLGNCSWEILATTRGKTKPGEFVVVGQGLRIVLESQCGSGRWLVRPLVNGNGGAGEAALDLLRLHGQVPLPPYVRKGREDRGDRTSYQTIFASRPGSVAAPTAGLHFSESIFRELGARGIEWSDLTLHIGIGTFRPIETEKISDHEMHPEWAELSAPVATVLNAKRALGGRIVAIGTTSARTLETAAAIGNGTMAPFAGETRLFIQPGHAFRGLDALITNFHLPRSSLLVLVSAFAGIGLIRKAYLEAVRCGYRFYSYGDAMLIV